MEAETALDLEIRRKIYTFILKSPGLHERELSRSLDIPLSTLDYHLFYLKKRNLISAQQDKGYTRYFCTEKIRNKDKQVLGILRQRLPRSIVLFLLSQNSSSHKQICTHLGVAASTTSFHLSKLTEFDVVKRTDVGRETWYSIVDTEYISDLLISYQKSFLDSAVDRFVESWFEVHPKHLRKQDQKDE